jgi:hypothetical protein
MGKATPSLDKAGLKSDSKKRASCQLKAVTPSLKTTIREDLHIFQTLYSKEISSASSS